MTDGTISTIVSLIVGMLATTVATVVVTRTRERERHRVDEHEALALRDARLRAEHALLDGRLGQLREEVADLQRQRTDLVAEFQAATAGGDPSPAVAEGALRRAHAHRRNELARRLRAAGDARVIPFPFLRED